VKVGVVGLGKVGLPLALVLAEHGGHEVAGYDVDLRQVQQRLRAPATLGDPGFTALVERGWSSRFKLAGSVEAVVAHAEVVFVVVQTLHGPGYGGETPMPAEPADFDYTQLKAACDELRLAALNQRKHLTVAVVSTVLPGTIRRELVPPTLGNPEGVSFVYNPALISLGSVVQDLLQPDFVLVGADDREAAWQVASIWREINHRGQFTSYLRWQFHLTSIESAELLKVALNAYLSSKIAFVNTLAQLCHHIDGADVDEVTDGLKLSRKAMGPFGLQAGLGDGGPCRPRDLIALSWLHHQHLAKPDPFRFVAEDREEHAHWLAWIVAGLAKDHRLPVVVLGLAYKPGTHLGDGSPARLLVHYLRELGANPYPFDPVSDGLGDGYTWARRAVFVLATPHEEFLGWTYPAGSVVVDPHGLVKDQDGVTVIRPGRR
jgi:UDPglucose 6-dehydrogenase